ncbi:MAG: hypothetical protein KAZ69_15400, partial [Candidatus Microthrix sp.]
GRQHRLLRRRVVFHGGRLHPVAAERARIGPRGGVRAEWLAAAAQSFGTVLFNVSTGAALHTRQLSAERISSGRPTPRARWADTGTFVGALCFLVASAIYVVGPRPVTGGDA